MLIQSSWKSSDVTENKGHIPRTEVNTQLEWSLTTFKHSKIQYKNYVFAARNYLSQEKKKNTYWRFKKWPG